MAVKFAFNSKDAAEIIVREVATGWTWETKFLSSDRAYPTFELAAQAAARALLCDASCKLVRYQPVLQQKQQQIAATYVEVLRIWNRHPGLPSDAGRWTPCAIDRPLRFDAPAEALEEIANRYRQEYPDQEFKVSATKPR